MDLNSQLVQSQCSFHYMSNSSPREILILQESAPGGVIFCVFVFCFSLPAGAVFLKPGPRLQGSHLEILISEYSFSGTSSCS